LSIYFGRGQRSRQRFGHCGSKSPFCGGLSPKRLSFSVLDRLVFAGLYRLFPKICDALAILKLDTIVRWHRAGFRLYWRWKSRRRGGRPTVPLEIRKLIREMSIANPLWGAPRIHGELLKLGIDIGQTSVAKYMARRRGPPSQGWKTFLNNHADGIAAMDLFVVPTISFRLLYGLLMWGMVDDRFCGLPLQGLHPARSSQELPYWGSGAGRSHSRTAFPHSAVATERSCGQLVCTLAQ
jgi:hypothetical protein